MGLFFEKDFMNSSKIVSVKSLGKQKTYNLTMKSGQHNYAVYDKSKKNFIVSANSHSVCYTYISSRQLYLKAHYPLEFYCAALCCQEKDDKIRDYMNESNRNGFEVQRLDLNKSKENFSINPEDNKIYYGFGNVKGIGEDKAKKIELNQPYKGFFDFLQRYGHDANTIKALLCLRVFKEGAPRDLYISYLKYVYRYNDLRKHKVDVEETEVEILNETTIEFPELVKDGVVDIDALKELYSKLESIKKGKKMDPDLKRLKKIYRKVIKVEEKKAFIQMSLDTPEFAVPIEKLKIDNEFIEHLEDERACEKECLGFCWTSKLTTCPDYKGGYTFEDHKVKTEEEGYNFAAVSAEVLSVQERKTKRGDPMYLVTIADVMGSTQVVSFWNTDYEIFKEKLAVGNCISIQLSAKNEKYSSYNMRAVDWKNRADKKEYRLVRYREANE